jgi:hypothetical protein
MDLYKYREEYLQQTKITKWIAFRKYSETSHCSQDIFSVCVVRTILSFKDGILRSKVYVSSSQTQELLTLNGIHRS